jgi:hypothetical protein
MNALRTDIIEAVGRGWTHPENSHKVMDSELAMAIVHELCVLFHAEDYEEKCKECGGLGYTIGRVGQDTQEQIQCQSCFLTSGKRLL